MEKFKIKTCDLVTLYNEKGQRALDNLDAVSQADDKAIEKTYRRLSDVKDRYKSALENYIQQGGLGELSKVYKLMKSNSQDDLQKLDQMGINEEDLDAISHIYSNIVSVREQMKSPQKRAHFNGREPERVRY